MSVQWNCIQSVVKDACMNVNYFNLKYHAIQARIRNILIGQTQMEFCTKSTCKLNSTEVTGGLATAGMPHAL